ncbi:M43 family zinc metalloprotease [Fluviicola taffensis]|uniref:PKD domain containing protein n=1 Tax=Fluviicola taffensis (strain DSM 16823 / NCIMB 13979 / RW262) TaxID=755732 RepID=F2IF85_FLUTR|nr:M43 family zinc metalloprotease [Fluviicola taffensis]AEA43559.1 PKD domain containing protein [Fluviicola taffensis DSM 16823]
MKSLLFTCALGILVSMNAFGQEIHLNCNHPNPTTESLKQIKSLLTHSQKSTDLKIFPVVFHVLHQNGSENISEAQIYEAMTYLNADFQKLNADTISVVSPFDTLIGKVNFEFRLATIDPNGNPTNGITRILTPLTTGAKENSKIYGWDPSKYINIWVVRSFEEPISGLTHNPLSLGPDPCADGIMMLNSYLGSIGTGNSQMIHFLTHEMGHFFGLYHLMENTNAPFGTNDCGYSDGIEDTPHTSEAYSCFNNLNTCNDSLYSESFNYWGYDVPDMEQNFLAANYCSRMFTKGQVALMRSVAESPIYGRAHLWSASNLVATGTGPGSVISSIVPPSSDFSFQTNTSGGVPLYQALICSGNNVSFNIQNGQPAGTTYLWSFSGAVPASSTLSNPTVNYGSPGFYDVTLTATNANGSSTTSHSSIVYASDSWPDFIGPMVQDFNVSGDFWLSQNLNEDNGYFQRIGNHGTQNSGCFLLGNRYEPDTTNLCYSTSILQTQLSKDNLISPAFDLSNSTSITISFDYAYGSAVIPDSAATEVLKVYYSRDCGKTWVLKKTIADTALITAFVPQNANFIPAQNQWRTISFPFTGISTDNKTRFKFEFVASNYSNNFYVDNFVIDGVLGISDSELSGIGIYPNPSQKGGIITISGLPNSTSQLLISDMQGKLVFQKELSDGSSESEVQLSTDLKSGCYLVEVTQNGSKFLTRLILE